MTRYLIIIMVIVLSNVQLSYGIGLGDPVDRIKDQYKGKIIVQQQDYFGKPPRAGVILFNTKDLFGSNASIQQFYSTVRGLMPSDAKLTAAYSKKSQYLKELYVFKSKSLMKVPEIQSAM